jgi:predicted  nucleic acid-binding Zn-ribbon protein
MHMQVVIEQDSADIPNNHQSTSKTLKELETKVNRLESSLHSLEKKLEQAVISEEDYQEMKEYYSFQITGLNAEIAKNKKREDRLLACSEEIRNKYAEFYDLPELTREIIVTFIERIDVKSKTDIAIKFRYRDIFRTAGDADGT